MAFLKPAVVIIAISFMALLARELLPQVLAHGGDIRWPALAFTLLLLMLVFMHAAIGWLLLLYSLGHRLAVLPQLRVWLLSSVTRYIPGGLWSFLSRAEMTRGYGVDMASIGTALYLEAVMLASTSLVIGVPALLMAGNLMLSWWQLLLAILAGGCMLHPTVVALPRHLPWRIGRMFRSLCLPGFGFMLVLYLYYLVFWCLMGVVFVYFVSMFHSMPSGNILPIGSSFAASFFFGFIIIFIPGGYGIRESALVFLLAPYMSLPTAVFISVASRLWTIAGELLTVTVVEAIYRYRYRDRGLTLN